jgi:hypothetical protein
MKVRWGLLLSFVVGVCFASTSPVFADQGDSADDGSDGQDKPTTRQDDDRLPPVLPGEEVVTQTGQKMRVWSSAGPVPMNVQPTPQTLNGGGYGYGGPAVIVDGRGFEGRGIPGR